MNFHVVILDRIGMIKSFDIPLQSVGGVLLISCKIIAAVNASKSLLALSQAC